LQGRLVLLNFRATWRPPCIRELPDLDSVYRGFESDDFVLIAITDEDAATVNKFPADHLFRDLFIGPGELAASVANICCKRKSQ
jgi:thiol-disulfide isomerase/thioredoxin